MMVPRKLRMRKRIVGVGLDAVAVVGAMMAGACENGTMAPSVASDTIRVLRPVSSDTLRAGEPFTIRWQLPSGITRARVEFSSDSGQNWRTLSVTPVEWPENSLSFTPRRDDGGVRCFVRVFGSGASEFKMGYSDSFRVHAFCSGGTLVPINGVQQVCNPSTSMDTENYPGCMTWLGFTQLDVNVPAEFASTYTLSNVELHDRLTVTDATNTVRWFLMRDSVPGVTGELQDPEWGAHPDYMAFLGRGADQKWDGFIVRVSDKAILKFSENGVGETSTPHVWVGESGSGVAPPPSGSGRYANGLLPRDSIYDFFGTTDVKITYSVLNGNALDLYLVDYSCDTCGTIEPRKMVKPEGRESYRVESALISPDGYWVTYNCYVTASSVEAYAQRLIPGSEPKLVAAKGAEPHWWFYGGRTNIVYSTEGGFTDGDLAEVTDGSRGKTMVQEVSLAPTGPQFVQFSLLEDPWLLLNYPFKGGLSPDGFYASTGYKRAYMFIFN